MYAGWTKRVKGETMAKYKVEYNMKEDKVTKTLTFMGKEYSEVWTEENSHCKCALEGLVDNDFRDLPEEVFEAVENITFSDDDEIVEYLQTLTDYERSQLKLKFNGGRLS